MRLLPSGPEALLVEVSGAAEAVVVYEAVRASSLAVRDVVPAARTVLLDGVRDVAAARELLSRLDLSAPGLRPSGQVVEVPTRYDGLDLAEVARQWDMTLAEAVATHTGTEFVVAFCGFAPGFAYCTGLPERLHVARLASPRPRVPAGSVALAGEFTGIYPSASPGGWRLVGHTDLTLWDTAASPPATLSPGTRVRFVEVSR